MRCIKHVGKLEECVTGVTIRRCFVIYVCMYAYGFGLRHTHVEPREQVKALTHTTPFHSLPSPRGRQIRPSAARGETESFRGGKRGGGGGGGGGVLNDPKSSAFGASTLALHFISGDSNAKARQCLNSSERFYPIAGPELYSRCYTVRIRLPFVFIVSSRSQYSHSRCT